MTTKTQEQLSPWTPDTDKTHLRVMGKALEELSECSNALARCIIQGIEESEPVTGKPNRKWLTEEVADAITTLRLVQRYMGLDPAEIAARVLRKEAGLEGWIEDMALSEAVAEGQ